MDYSIVIKRILDEEGFDYKERPRTLHTLCPRCGKSDKLSILKANGATICYRGKCQFKGFFVDWLMQTLNITRAAARERLESKPAQYSSALKLNLNNPVPHHVQSTDLLLPCEWPDRDFIPIGDILALDGQRYLQGRGIPVEVAQQYDIHYSPSARRVVFPVLLDGQCYGWQARAIDNVPSSDRMRNNTGFHRGSLVMFLHRAKEQQPIIITEGPIDAMKFHRVGQAVATLGKVITAKQIEMIKQYAPSMVYLALDDDAVPEMRELISSWHIPMRRILVPQSCIERCNISGRKADFGECTFDECLGAYNEAVQLDVQYLMTNWADTNQIWQVSGNPVERAKHETKKV